MGEQTGTLSKIVQQCNADHLQTRRPRQCHAILSSHVQRTTMPTMLGFHPPFRSSHRGVTHRNHLIHCGWQEY